jgi:hypothetical protein
MNVRTLRAPLAAALLWSGVTACNILDTQGLPLQYSDIEIDFCSDQVPVWFVYQNENQPWERVQPDANGTFAFSASNRVGLAWVRLNGADVHLEMVFTSNAQLENMAGSACLESGAAKQVNGSVSGVVGDDRALVSMSAGSFLLPTAQTAFALSVPDRPVDLVASRIAFGAGEQHATHTIIRRTLDPVPNATLVPLDFDGNEATLTDFNVATLGGVLPADQVYLSNELFTQLGTSHLLTFLDPPLANGNHEFAALPNGVLAAGDFQVLIGAAVQPNGGVRGVRHYYSNSENQTLALGPELNIPQVSTVATSPYVRLRSRLEAQVPYTTMLNIRYLQQAQLAVKTVDLVVTASYFGGTPFFWDIQTPDFTGAPGWENAWGLTTGAYDWEVSAFFGRPELVLGAPPTGIEDVPFATHMSSASATRATHLSSASITRMTRGVRAGWPTPGIFSRNHRP